MRTAIILLCISKYKTDGRLVENRPTRTLGLPQTSLLAQNSLSWQELHKMIFNHASKEIGTNMYKSLNWSKQRNDLQVLEIMLRGIIQFVFFFFGHDCENLF